MSNSEEFDESKLQIWRTTRTLLFINLILLAVSVSAGACSGVFLSVTDNPVRDEVRERLVTPTHFPD